MGGGEQERRRSETAERERGWLWPQAHDAVCVSLPHVGSVCVCVCVVFFCARACTIFCMCVVHAVACDDLCGIFMACE